MVYRWVLMACLLVLPYGIAQAADWETDFQKAAAIAKQSNRYLLANFSGSDWCGWCMKLDKEVFSRKDFKQYAKDHLVLVLIDFPRNKPQSRKEKERNAALARQHGVKGFPTVLLFSPEGELVGHTGYQPGGAEAYVAYLNETIEKHRSSQKKPPAPP